MKKEYDFSKAERGRFYHPDAKMNMPVYLDDDIQSWFETKAKAQGVELHQLVNALLRQDIALIKEVTNR